jgi:hypothetical protein
MERPGYDLNLVRQGVSFLKKLSPTPEGEATFFPGPLNHHGATAEH